MLLRRLRGRAPRAGRAAPPENYGRDPPGARPAVKGPRNASEPDKPTGQEELALIAAGEERQRSQRREGRPEGRPRLLDSSIRPAAVQGRCLLRRVCRRLQLRNPGAGGPLKSPWTLCVGRAWRPKRWRGGGHPSLRRRTGDGWRLRGTKVTALLPGRGRAFGAGVPPARPRRGPPPSVVAGAGPAQLAGSGYASGPTARCSTPAVSQCSGVGGNARAKKALQPQPPRQPAATRTQGSPPCSAVLQLAPQTLGPCRTPAGSQRSGAGGKANVKKVLQPQPPWPRAAARPQGSPPWSAPRTLPNRAGGGA